MELVKNFLNARRCGDADTAVGMLEPHALLGSPWGYRYGDKEYVEFLKDEKKFRYREYLKDVAIQEIAPNTFQRKFEYDRGLHQHEFMRSALWTNKWFGWLPLMRGKGYYREVYWVEGDKIKMVTCFQQP